MPYGVLSSIVVLIRGSQNDAQLVIFQRGDGKHILNVPYLAG